MTTQFYLPDQVQLFPQTASGVVIDQITSEEPGRVKFQSSEWPARFYRLNASAIAPPGTLVNIIGIQGITLLVTPLNHVLPESIRKLAKNSRIPGWYW